ncbi:bifunctional phosphoribosyl-AMP cyclohydrolase/phosphoribosyl-ATP diphosphatase HisIE [Patescibacteria group bacterium]|nr:bifunctional phosphoribosyl-AMP cyclohydrolase/phosphoribosyl-ATP diphosphatase HisIE [Patescibacteria group bacterium]MBU1683711.1 bifunctional phosphoribosyl-AMP cyclohydrolase/phosphoribosyl-ATP diphosphatase HisIE [Patescibacteria group bacterium]MBU1934508.1 bifunctional phosphoribosyl-AMP cyclohydrolase/phosphoribosyl-ATP diphosphatase HisIE [Patescibacteria group bacterium]
MKNLVSKINWQKIDGLIPAVIQNDKTSQVLMLAYMNQESLKKTIKTKKVCFYSRTKKRLWMKGEESGNCLSLINIRLDCDQDALLISVDPKGPTCHTGEVSCFGEIDRENVLTNLYNLIAERKKNLPQNSYTASLFKEGLGKICEKVEEESEEVIRAAKKESKKRVIEESADVLYHLFILMAEKDVSLLDVENELIKRK